MLLSIQIFYSILFALFIDEDKYNIYRDLNILIKTMNKIDFNILIKVYCAFSERKDKL